MIMENLLLISSKYYFLEIPIKKICIKIIFPILKSSLFKRHIWDFSYFFSLLFLFNQIFLVELFEWLGIIRQIVTKIILEILLHILTRLILIFFDTIFWYFLRPLKVSFFNTVDHSIIFFLSFGRLRCKWA